MYFETLDSNRLNSQISGSRSEAVYTLFADQSGAEAIAKDICLEQTVEFPGSLTPEPIQQTIVGRIESLEPVGENRFSARISYADESMTGELVQLFNVLFGNISIKPGIRLESFRLSDALLSQFRGPRFGIAGIRKLVGVPDRPLLFTALKPMGLDAVNLSDLAYEFAMGGVDVIKDDHGLGNQPFAAFRDRVEACAAAVAKANRQTGRNVIYAPNVTGPALEMLDRARFARQAGADALLVSPGLSGFDIMRAIADDEFVAAPILAHPAFLGSFAINPFGIAHGCLFGQMMRLAGADATIFPNYGGRFSFSVQECLNIVKKSQEPMGDFPGIFPCPAGGMTLEKIPDMVKTLGRDIMLLIGGGLFSYSPDLRANCQAFLEKAKDNS